MAMPAKTLLKVSTQSPHTVHTGPQIPGVVHTSPQPELRCESCGRAIESLRDVIIEDEYGFEGEAWGTFFRQEPHEVAISACCRANIIDSSGESMDAYILKEEL